jgi:hypothetical protein
MIEVAEVFCRFVADYHAARGASMLPSHRRAIEDTLDFRQKPAYGICDDRMGLRVGPTGRTCRTTAQDTCRRLLHAG